MGIQEALSWVKELQPHDAQVLVESDSLLITVTTIKGDGSNFLEMGEVEVGEVIE